jgi:hypothetical protein
LTQILRELLGSADAASFQLMGEDLLLVSGAELRAAAERYEADLARVPAALRADFQKEQTRVLREAHAFLRRYNRSVLTRIDGYVSLGQRCDFAYPWPIVAILGIHQVRTGLFRNRVYGLLGPGAQRLGLAVLERLTEGTEDVLRRTNRGIFADSVPTVLLGLAAHALRARGQTELADALLAGPLPLLLDEESRAIARGLDSGLCIADPAKRFRALADLTLRHFGREQAIFTHHLAAPVPTESARRREPSLLRKMTLLREIPAPVVERTPRGRRLRIRAFALPAGFDIRDHKARVEIFGRAFVTSVTGDAEDYRAAVDFVNERFGKRSR